MAELIILLIILVINKPLEVSLAEFLPNRYTKTDEAWLGKNLLNAHTVNELTRGSRCQKSPPIRWPGHLR
jgi:hypothetical protein